MINCSALKISFYFSADFFFFLFSSAFSLHYLRIRDLCVWTSWTHNDVLCAILHPATWTTMALNDASSVTRTVLCSSLLPTTTATITTLKKSLQNIFTWNKNVIHATRVFKWLVLEPTSRVNPRVTWKDKDSLESSRWLPAYGPLRPLTLVVRKTLWWTRFLSYFMQFLWLPGRGRGSTEVIEAAYCCW